MNVAELKAAISRIRDDVQVTVCTETSDSIQGYCYSIKRINERTPDGIRIVCHDPKPNSDTRKAYSEEPIMEHGNKETKNHAESMDIHSNYLSGHITALEQHGDFMLKHREGMLGFEAAVGCLCECMGLQAANDLTRSIYSHRSDMDWQTHLHGEQDFRNVMEKWGVTLSPK